MYATRQQKAISCAWVGIGHTNKAANEETYPNVARLVCKLLPMSATSVASERLFSKAGDVISNKKLTRRWGSECELSLRRHRTHTTKCNRLVYKFHRRSTWLCVRTQVYQIQWNNAMQWPLCNSRSFKGISDRFCDDDLMIPWLKLFSLVPESVSLILCDEW